MTNIHLIGSEEVGSAGHRMVSAAQDMRSAASTMEQALYAHRQFMDEWLQRFENIMEKQHDREKARSSLEK